MIYFKSLDVCYLHHVTELRNGILLPKLFWPTVKKIVLVIKKNFWNSISNKQTVFKSVLNKLKKDLNPITFLGLWTRTVEFYFHYFFARFISLSHKEKSFIRHKELKIKIDCECKYNYILRKKGLNILLLKSVNRKNRTQDTQSKLSFKQLTHEIWATLVWDKKALKINAPLA